jgi:type VI protein secretion system component VasK
MSHSFILLAQLDALNRLNPTAQVGKSTGLLFKDMLVIVGTGLVLALLLVLWARHYVKKKKRRRRHQPPHERAAAARVTAAELEEKDEMEEAGTQIDGRHSRRRRHRRDHRPRNPTLAETGGLPPDKSEGPSTSSL